MRTFAIVNRKGGVGKTTTAVNLAYVLATSCHLRVLLVDADGQANATQILLPRGEYAGLGALLRGYAICYEELTVHTDVEGLDVLPASEDLWALDLEARESCRYSALMQMRDAVEEDGTYADLFEIYRDYLDAAWSLGYCLEHSKVLWPDQLFSAHDAAMEKLANKNKETQARNLKARRLKYEFELDGLKIVFPVTTAAIKREGKALAHCVGGYAERHMKGVTTILFLRRVDQPHTPYITLEMDGNRIRQIHGYHNDTLPGSQNPRAVCKTFLNTWLRWLEAGSKRNEDGTPKLPKRKKAVEHEGEARTA